LLGLACGPLVPGTDEVVGVPTGILTRRVVVELHPHVVKEPGFDGGIQVGIRDRTLRCSR